MSRQKFNTEQKVAAIERKIATMYQMTYARYKRRSNIDKNVISRALTWERNYKKYNNILLRAASLLGKHGGRRTIVRLNPTEFTKFRKWLKKDFRGRGN